MPRLGPPGRGRENILLVDDDADLCSVITLQMQGLGYRVTPCTDSQEALRLLTQDHPCDLLFTDLVMPGLSGQELIRRALDLRPGLPVVICAGQPETPALDAISAPNLRAVLAKPATLEEMAQALRTALTPPTSSQPSRS